jgi:hypothetical protein
MVTYLPPVVAAVAGVTLLGEHLSWNQPVGGLIVLAGVGVAQGLAARAIRAREDTQWKRGGQALVRMLRRSASVEDSS